MSFLDRLLQSIRGVRRAACNQYSTRSIPPWRFVDLIRLQSLRDHSNNNNKNQNAERDLHSILKKEAFRPAFCVLATPITKRREFASLVLRVLPSSARKVCIFCGLANTQQQSHNGRWLFADYICNQRQQHYEKMLNSLWRRTP